MGAGPGNLITGATTISFMAEKYVYFALVDAVAVIIRGAHGDIIFIDRNAGSKVIAGIAFMGSFIGWQAAICGQAGDHTPPLIATFKDPGSTLLVVFAFVVRRSYDCSDILSADRDAYCSTKAFPILLADRFQGGSFAKCFIPFATINICFSGAVGAGRPH